MTDDAREHAYVGVDFLCLLYESFSMRPTGTISVKEAIPRSKTYLSDFRRTLSFTRLAITIWPPMRRMETTTERT